MDLHLSVFHNDKPLAGIVVEMLPLVTPSTFALHDGRGLAGPSSAHLAECNRVGRVSGFGWVLLPVGPGRRRRPPDLLQQGPQRRQGAGDNSQAALAGGPEGYEAKVV